jgi:glutamate dehydrogenase (NAD(P)+)
MNGEVRDPLGPCKVIEICQPELGLEGVLVVDNVAAGPAIGGLRLAADVTVDECRRLARAMTLKNAAAGLPHGGAKSALRAEPHGDPAHKEALIRAFACALRGNEEYIFGPDMGTDERCMGWVHDEIGRAIGLPRALGGIPLDELGATAFGLIHAIEVAAERIDLPLEGARIVVQGFGSVGRHAARFLAERGARLVAAADSVGAVANADGLDVDALEAWKTAGNPLTTFAGGRPLAAEQLIEVDCEVWIPAARPDVIDAGNCDRLSARLVAEGANIPVTTEAGARLHARGVLCLPDFIVNAGGVICGAVEYRGGGQEAAFAAIRERVRANTAEILQRSQRDAVTPRQAALALAERRVREAMATRRWSLF